MTSVMPNGLVEFRFYRPDAQDVNVVGSFNGWGARQIALQPDAHEQGWWTARTLIEPGEYSFRYRVNGSEWFTDYAANGVERNKHGWNSILIVPEPKARIMPVAMPAEIGPEGPSSLRLTSDDEPGPLTDAIAA